MMTIHEIRSASARQFSEARAEAAQTSETTPVAITPAILDFARNVLGGEPDYIPVVADPHGLYGWCSDGVQQKILADGGRPIFGWALWEWPGALITAEFHAAWESPEEVLFDITPKPGGETSILFVPDRSYSEEFDFDQRPRNRRARLYQEVNRFERAQRIAAELAGAKRIYEKQRAAKAKLPLEEWLLRKVPVDPIPGAIDDLISICEEFEEHHDSLGVSGMIDYDDKFIELMTRRVAIANRFKMLCAHSNLAQRNGKIAAKLLAAKLTEPAEVIERMN